MEALHLPELLHNVSQGLKYPVMLILALLIIYALWCIGSVIVELIVERRHFKAAMPEMVADIDAAEYKELPNVIERSGLLRSHKTLLETIVAYGFLPETDRVGLAKRLLNEAEMHYVQVSSRTDLAAKVAPMIGLMGTLIPLGPGIVALGQAKTDVLASSIEIAFDTTVAGLVVAAVAMVISRLRKNWYEDYLTSLEAGMSAVLQKAQDCADNNEDLGNAESAAAFVAQIKQRKGHEAVTAIDLSSSTGQKPPAPPLSSSQTGSSSENGGE